RVLPLSRVDDLRECPKLEEARRSGCLLESENEPQISQIDADFDNRVGSPYGICVNLRHLRLSLCQMRTLADLLLHPHLYPRNSALRQICLGCEGNGQPQMNGMNADEPRSGKNMGTGMDGMDGKRKVLKNCGRMPQPLSKIRLSVKFADTNQQIGRASCRETL